MNKENTVTIKGIQNLAIFISQLVREGVTWTCFCDNADDAEYIVTLTGGF